VSHGSRAFRASGAEPDPHAFPGGKKQAYDGGYIGLLKKRLIEASADHQSFTITNAGLKLLATGIK
jgi:hypothetical protein